MISIHQCPFFSDSKWAVTDEADKIRGETAKLGRRKKPGGEERGAYSNETNDKFGTSGFKG